MYVVALIRLNKKQSKRRDNPHDNCFSTIKKDSRTRNQEFKYYMKKRTAEKDNFLPLLVFGGFY
jgi:hypothetical protein